jgi:hypothetical protein
MSKLHWGSVAIGAILVWFVLPMFQQLVAKGKTKS